MTHPVSPGRRLLVAAALLLVTAACQREQASVEELYTTRMLGLGHLQRNELPEAEAEFAKLTRLAPDDPFGHAYLGLTFLQAGRFADAESELRRAEKLDPASTEIGLMLARLYALTGRPSDARATLERLRRDSTRDPHVLYALAQLDSGRTDAASTARYEARLRELLAIAPANLVARLKLVQALAGRGEMDSVVRQLEEVRRIPPAAPREARVHLDSSIQLARGGDVARTQAALDRFADLMEVTAPYQTALDEIRWTEAPIAGRPVLTFAPQDFVSVQGVRERASVDLVRFVDVTAEAGFREAGPPAGDSGGPAAPVALAAGDVDGDGTDDVLIAAHGGPGERAARLYRMQGGFVRDVTEASAVSIPRGASFATFADYDNDGWLDIFAIDIAGRGVLLRNRGDGTFADATAQARVAEIDGARSARFVDLDHDGDLDLLLAGSARRVVYRNNLDGTFTDAAANTGLSPRADARDAAFADFDGDGRIDVLIASEQGGAALFHNGGAQRFSDVTTTSGLSGTTGAVGVAAGDYDNDGFIDVLVVRASGEPTLFINDERGSFSLDRRSAAVMRPIAAIAVTSARFLDYDNDGWLDFLVGGSARGSATPALFLFRNDRTGRFIDRSTILPAAARAAGASTIAITDVDRDGDEDLILADAAGGPRLLRNDFGNSNLAMNVELKSLGTGSGKNNAFGVGARLTLRAGEIFQTRVATGRVTHFGLGPHLKADVLRIEWPNGVPQTIHFPGTDEDVVEREMLKGSCAFAYTWDGTRFRFVTDAMWRSALGMPLGLMGSTSAFAPAGASQEFVRIAGDALRPRNGRYVLQLTEELWETAYADEVRLLAIDHPDSVEVFVDERFVPPGPVTRRVHEVSRREVPRSARDERGHDVLAALREADDVFVSNLTPTRYQGVVEPHDLVLDLGANAGNPGTYLFLRGWIYPTDASINVALGQQSTIKLAFPVLEVRDAAGRWRAVADIGFPSGKDKTIVVDLAGIFPTADRRVRIRTNMQIYWDQAFVGHARVNGASRVTTLEPMAADLHFRGFSRMYRKGGRYGPYWFEYEDVTKESPWRPIEGAFTRFGDVLPLLRAADDMYVIMAPGDEMTVEFDARSADSLPAGWRRDFLLYTDGWIKDSDLNTAHGTTVEPLPFHAVKSYPYASGEAYPTDSAHRRYRREYNTRVVGPRTTLR